MEEQANSGEQENANNQEAANAERGNEQDFTMSHDEVMEFAKANGWKEDGPQDVKTFIKTMPGRFKDKGRELKDLKRSVDAIKNTFEKAQETAFQRGIEQAQAKLKEAKENLDPDAIEAATRELEQAKTNKPTIAEKLSEEAEAFINNPILDKDPDLFTDAMDYRNKYLQTHPGDIDGALLYTKRKMEKDYPDVFGKKVEPQKEERKPPAGGVEGVRGGDRTQPQWQKDKALLLDHEKELMKSFTSQLHNGKPVMTEQQYIENLRAQGAFQGRGK